MALERTPIVNTKRLSRLLQPVVQVVASFPSPMLYTIVLGGLALIGMGLNWGSILLMLLGTIGE